MLNYKRYQKNPVVNYPEREWPNKEITKAPIWCSVDLRDGNQALIDPMIVQEKVEFFNYLIKQYTRTHDTDRRTSQNQIRVPYDQSIKQYKQDNQQHICNDRNDKFLITFYNICCLLQVFHHLLIPFQ